MEGNALLTLSTSRREDWLHGEVDALDAHEQLVRLVRESDLLRLPREGCFDRERCLRGERHSGTQRLSGVWRTERRCQQTVKVAPMVLPNRESGKKGA